MTTSIFTLAMVSMATNVGMVFDDPLGDQYNFGMPPLLDLTSISVDSDSDSLFFTLAFDSVTASSGDLEKLSGWIDFDCDQDTSTGKVSHFEEFWIEPVITLGVDYYLEFSPWETTANLVYVENGVEQYILTCDVIVGEATVNVTVPRCITSPLEGICFETSFDFAVLIGNEWGSLTDRAPNDSCPFTYVVPEPSMFALFVIGYLVTESKKRKRELLGLFPL